MRSFVTYQIEVLTICFKKPIARFASTIRNIHPAFYNMI
ncbi:hypothetical protein CEV32_3500 [Brucella rhizosphaerae]|uniref:Uncharacterized protein n=1 Tax=Brucella rhizosphaerae TaxID=571254 RepID=A0A256FUL0_9HYPH|nr:hypothetical protein CEV32_3500 [Brucella rhizosphaerae]